MSCKQHLSENNTANRNAQASAHKGKMTDPTRIPIHEESTVICMPF